MDSTYFYQALLTANTWDLVDFIRFLRVSSEQQAHNAVSLKTCQTNKPAAQDVSHTVHLPTTPALSIYLCYYFFGWWSLKIKSLSDIFFFLNWSNATTFFIKVKMLSYCAQKAVFTGVHKYLMPFCWLNATLMFCILIYRRSINSHLLTTKH